MACFIRKETAEACLRWLKGEQTFTHTKIVKGDAEALPGFSQVYGPDGLSSTCALKAGSLKQLLLWEGGGCIPRTQKGGEASKC